MLLLWYLRRYLLWYLLWYLLLHLLLHLLWYLLHLLYLNWLHLLHSIHLLYWRNSHKLARILKIHAVVDLRRIPWKLSVVVVLVIERR